MEGGHEGLSQPDADPADSGGGAAWAGVRTEMARDSVLTPTQVTYAAPCIRRHMEQWQWPANSDGSAKVYRTAPQKHDPLASPVAAALSAAAGARTAGTTCCPTRWSTARDMASQLVVDWVVDWVASHYPGWS